MTRACIFGGTAAYNLKLDEYARVAETVPVDTPYGRVELSGLVTASGTQVLFLSRHGRGALERTAAFVNHRANIWAAARLNADAILSWNGCGAINEMLSVGDVLVPSDLIDQTRARAYTFGQAAPGAAPALLRGEVTGGAAGTRGRPFWEPARTALVDAARAHGLNVHAWGTYACTEGPRLESPAEIRMLRDAHADVVGMTLSPEVWLAAEMGLYYASLCYVTNWATGLQGNDRRFGPEVGETCLKVVLAAAERLASV